MASRKSKKSAKKTMKKAKRAPSEWNLLVTAVYKELKAANKNASLGDAMKEAKRRKDAKK
jgi:hypothetical protein